MIRPTRVVGPIRFSNTGAATTIVRTWARVNPRAIVAAVTVRAVSRPGYRLRVPRRDAAVAASAMRIEKPSHTGGSDGNPK